MITFIYTDTRLLSWWSFLKGQARSLLVEYIILLFSLMVCKYVQYAFWVMDIICAPGWCPWPVRSLWGGALTYLNQVTVLRNSGARKSWICHTSQALIATAEQCRHFPEIQTNTCLRKSVSSGAQCPGCLVFTINTPRYVATLLIFRTIQARSSSSSHCCLGLEKPKGQGYVAMQMFPNLIHVSGDVFQRLY